MLKTRNTAVIKTKYLKFARLIKSGIFDFYKIVLDLTGAI